MCMLRLPARDARGRRIISLHSIALEVKVRRPFGKHCAAAVWVRFVALRYGLTIRCVSTDIPHAPSLQRSILYGVPCVAEWSEDAPD